MQVNPWEGLLNPLNDKLDINASSPSPVGDSTGTPVEECAQGGIAVVLEQFLDAIKDLIDP